MGDIYKKLKAQAKEKVEKEIKEKCEKKIFLVVAEHHSQIKPPAEIVALAPSELELLKEDLTFLLDNRFRTQDVEREALLKKLEWIK